MEKGKSKIRLFLTRHQKPLRTAMAVVAGLITLVFLCIVAFFGTISAGLPDVRKLDRYDPSQTTKIYARDGTLVATLFDQNRTPVTIDKVSKTMQQAIVAIEDRRFYEHQGVDYKGIIRAALGNFTSGEVEQGASTLTMQLARRLFLDNERTYSRKLREAILARRIDRTLSKDKILELYLNEVYFGAGAYGIDAAASLYFKTEPKDLNLWQSALLAGVVQAPTAFSPLEDRKASLRRMDQVLAAMEQQGIINNRQRLEAVKSASGYKFKNNGLEQSHEMLKYPYFTTYAIKELSELFPQNYIRRGGLQVYTTLDLELQQAAEQALSNRLNGEGVAMGADAGAVVMLDNESGELLAMVGGTEWDTENQFNRAWQARRQPGSSFKMFVYAAALENGFHPEQEFADTEAVFNYDTPNAWSPKNSDHAFMGAIPMRSGLQFSRNLVAAKVLAHVGPSKVVTLARQMGISDKLPQVISLALGTCEVTPLEMARAYSVLPNGGRLKPNRVILKVTTPDGELLKDFSGDKVSGERVLSEGTATLMCEMLHRVVTAGTGSQANVAGTYIAGKTGTTDSFIDAWFVGFNPKFTLSVWIGRDDNKPMGRVYGGTIPANVFHDVMVKAVASRGGGDQLPGVAFTEPAVSTLCWESTYLALPTCPRTYQDTFQAGVVPTRQCPMHRQLKKKTVITRTADGALTNIDLSPTPAVTPENDQESKLDPRQDPEVVTALGSMVPYQEKAPKSKLKVVEIQVEKIVPTATPSADDGDLVIDMDPIEEPDRMETGTGGEGQPIMSSEAEAPQAGPEPSGNIVRIERESSYPKAQPRADKAVDSNPAQGQNEVIYTNQDLSIPADPVDQ